ncbi:MAG: hypothetical protein ACPG4U_16630, partial [Pseudomonadales bacterium]
HPREVPVQVVVSDDQAETPEGGNSQGTGVYVPTTQPFAINTRVEVEINVQSPPFMATGYVSCCEPCASGKGYRLGVIFDCPETAFAVRMIEQICHIEQYRQQVSVREGRELSSDSAAQEWIRLHAADFPELHACQ